MLLRGSRKILYFGERSPPCRNLINAPGAARLLDWHSSSLFPPSPLSLYQWKCWFSLDSGFSSWQVRWCVCIAWVIVSKFQPANYFKRKFLNSTGLDGRACVMRALCEAAQRNPSDLGKGTLVQELLHAIFTWVNSFRICGNLTMSTCFAESGLWTWNNCAAEIHLAFMSLLNGTS